MKVRFGANDFEAAGSTPEQFATYILSEITKWGKVVKATGMQPE